MKANQLPSKCDSCKKIRIKHDPRADELQPLFKTECSDRAQEIDYNEELHWYALTVGWAIAKGLSPDDALSFATHIRYDTLLG